jgi:hypothetical protein
MLTPDAMSGESNPSELFGEDVGIKAYKWMIETTTTLADEPVVDIARRAVRVAMVTAGQFDIDIEMATNAVVTVLNSDVEAVW